MRSFIKTAITRSVRNETVWKALDGSVLKLLRFADWERQKLERAKRKEVAARAVLEDVERYVPDLVVKHGPFKGMKYPSVESVGSELFPKLIGSYEAELAPVWAKVCREPYTEIVDVGCAEGYYAVGLAMAVPSAKVYAYDVNEKAVALCRKMALLNGVGDRVVTGSFCDPETLKAIPFTGRALVISDCEGYEKELFTEEVAAVLARQDVLVELHDFMDLTISSVIRRRFERTHDVTVIQSVDDVKKAQTYRYEELDGLPLSKRKSLLGELRPSVMEWFYLTPKQAPK